MTFLGYFGSSLGHFRYFEGHFGCCCFFLGALWMIWGSQCGNGVKQRFLAAFERGKGDPRDSEMRAPKGGL